VLIYKSASRAEMMVEVVMLTSGKQGCFWRFAQRLLNRLCVELRWNG